MLLPISVSAPIRITSPSRPQSPTQLDSFPSEWFLSPGKEMIEPLSAVPATLTARRASPLPQPIIPKNIAVNDRSSVKPPALTTTRRRGRSGTARKVNLWPLITRPQGRSRSNAPKSTNNVGLRTQNLKKVGVDVCLHWVTDEPITRPVPPTPPNTPEHTNKDSYFPTVCHTKSAEQTTRDQLLQLIDSALRSTQNVLESLSFEQNNLYLHTAHCLSIADIDTNGDMFRLEGKVADLEECLERIKVLRDDVLYVHRWALSAGRSETDGEENAGDGENVATKRSVEIFKEVDVRRRLKQCFMPSTWWKDFDPISQDIKVTSDSNDTETN